MERFKEAKGVHPMNIPNMKKMEKWRAALLQVYCPFCFDLLSVGPNGEDGNAPEEG